MRFVPRNVPLPRAWGEHIREGKRSNDCVVPIGERALAWVEKYQREVREQLLTDPNNTVLFVSKLGDGFTAGHLTEIVRRYVKVADIGKTGSCHLFRHAMATLMLEGGADVRMVQAMLGHASLNTTALYTHVAIRALKEVHERTHPGAKLGKPETTKRKDGAAKVGAAELLAALEAEQAED